MAGKKKSRRLYMLMYQRRRRHEFYGITEEPSQNAVSRMERFKRFINEIRQLR